MQNASGKALINFNFTTDTGPFSLTGWKLAYRPSYKNWQKNFKTDPTNSTSWHADAPLKVFGELINLIISWSHHHHLFVFKNVYFHPASFNSSHQLFWHSMQSARGIYCQPLTLANKPIKQEKIKKTNKITGANTKEI